MWLIIAGPIGKVYARIRRPHTCGRLEFAIATPILAFLLGAMALWIGRWIAKGFRPSEPQAGE
jgi:hypothetical protein